MKFGYFVTGIKAGDSGAMAAVIEVRPLEPHKAMDAGARVIIHVPLDTSAGVQRFQELGAAALAQAEQLLPAQALEAWAAQWPGQLLDAPTSPPDARAQWREALFPAIEGLQQ